MIPTGERIPSYLKAGLDRYANNHAPVGGFLTAVLGNDLVGALSKADPEAVLSLHDIVGYCHNEIPSGCWGSPEKVKAWLSPTEDDMPEDREVYYNERAEALFDYGRDG